MSRSALCLGQEPLPHSHSGAGSRCRSGAPGPGLWGTRSSFPGPSGLWRLTQGSRSPANSWSPVTVNSWSRAVVTVPKSRCDCPVTRYPATRPCHRILSKQRSENGQQRPAWLVRCRAGGGQTPVQALTPASSQCWFCSDTKNKHRSRCLLRVHGPSEPSTCPNISQLVTWKVF